MHDHERCFFHQELIQNAEDAGASEVRFLYDQTQYGEKTLRSPKLVPCQGPALCAYNDACFTEEDWENIQNLSMSVKKGDPMKIGRFGQGFNSVYHLTDYVMRQTIGDREYELGFELERRKSRRHPPVVISDFDFADDIALLAEKIAQAQELLCRMENEAAKVGLQLNAGKTKLMAFNQKDPVIIKTKSGDTVEVVKNFKYLGSWMKDAETDFELYQDLPAVTDKIRERRMKIAGHCIRHPDILASSLVLWEPLKGKRSRGRPRVTFLDNLRKDTNLQDTREIKKAMEDKVLWRQLSGLVRAGARTKRERP
ncbi:hypothetical protein Bbelb_080720 [Branchiostoma belcheri]|nr:hypothetical protein Bbelb_080720 [Branchiostoma belcheri]